MDTQTENQEKKVKKPIYKQWWFYLIIGIVILSIIVYIVSPKVSEEETPETPSLPTYYIGDKVVVGSLEYTITRILDTQFFIKGEQLITTPDHYIRIYFTVRNLGNSTKYLSQRDVSLMRGEASCKLAYYDGDLSFFDLGAGLQHEFWVIYETPDTSTDTDYHLRVKDSKDSSLILLKEKPATEE